MTLKTIFCFFPCPTKLGIGVLVSPRMAVRLSVFRFRSSSHKHALGGVDVPFGVYEI